MPQVLNVLMFISLMQNLMQDSLNKTNNRYILLGQVPTKTLTFFMICTGDAIRQLGNNSNYKLNKAKSKIDSGDWIRKQSENRQ